MNNFKSDYFTVTASMKKSSCSSLLSKEQLQVRGAGQSVTVWRDQPGRHFGLPSAAHRNRTLWATRPSRASFPSLLKQENSCTNRTEPENCRDLHIKTPEQRPSRADWKSMGATPRGRGQTPFGICCFLFIFHLPRAFRFSPPPYPCNVYLPQT